MSGHLKALLSLAEKDYIWIEVSSDSIAHLLTIRLQQQALHLSSTDLKAFSKLMSRIIDFKSEFTASHSRGVAVTAVALARTEGFNKRQIDIIETAAFLHEYIPLIVNSFLRDSLYYLQ